MEYTQWDKSATQVNQFVNCLNPCCNGIYSMSFDNRKGLKGNTLS